MSIKSIVSYLKSYKSTFKPETYGSFSFGSTIGQPVKSYTLKKSGKNFTVDKHEMSIGNKRHVVINKYDYSNYPISTDVFTKEKGFVDGKLVFSSKKQYSTHESIGFGLFDFFDIY